MPTGCAYFDHTKDKHGGVRCMGPVVFTAHDKRGCRRVCFAHVKWLMDHSIAIGHSDSCPESAQ